jgi:hypothetical protein
VTARTSEFLSSHVSSVGKVCVTTWGLLNYGSSFLPAAMLRVLPGSLRHAKHVDATHQCWNKEQNQRVDKNRSNSDCVSFTRHLFQNIVS